MFVTTSLTRIEEKQDRMVEDIVNLKIRSSIWGALGGGIMAAIVALIAALAKK